MSAREFIFAHTWLVYAYSIKISYPKQMSKPKTWRLVMICFLFTLHRRLHKNIERYTADIIVSWPNPEQWVIVHTSDLMMIIRQSIYILSIITGEISKLKTYSPIYYIMDNGENMLNLTHTLDKIYPTGILSIPCLQINLHNDDNEMVYCTNKRVRSASQW